MSFLAMASQKTLFTLQKSQLEYEYTILMSRTNCIQGQMSDYATAAGDDAELDEDPFYISLEKTSEYLQTEADAVKAQVDMMDQEINALKTMVNNGIKSTCALNLVGGG